jgi:AP-1 complex subunit gamma-1
MQILSPPPPPSDENLIGPFETENIVATPVTVPVSGSAQDLLGILESTVTPSTQTTVASTTESILNLFSNIPSPAVPPGIILASPNLYSSPISSGVVPMGTVFPSVTPMMPNPMPSPIFTPIIEPTIVHDPAFPPLVAYQSAELTITFYFKKPNPAALQYTLINAVYTNNSGSVLVDLGVLAAPPRHAKYLQETISTRNVPPGGTATQVIKASNSMHGQKPLSMKLRITYSINNRPREIEHVCKDFPAVL